MDGPMRSTRLTSRAAVAAAATLTGLVGASLAPLAAAAADAPAHEQVVDITFPTDPRVTYGNDFTSPRSRGSHGATDLMGQKGWGVHAAVGGTVTWAPGSDGEPMRSYGYMVSIDGTDGRSYHYVHLNNDTPGTDDGRGGPARAFAPGIVKGATVARGQLIGFLGDSGNAEGTAPHLHFEIEDDAVTDPDGTNRINPFFSLNAARWRQDYPTVGAAVAPYARPTDDSCPSGAVPAHRFVDVAAGSTHGPSIACALWWQVATGVSATTFEPGRDVTRGQMASFVARLVAGGGGHLPSDAADRFTDDGGSPHEASINRLAAVGILGGVAPGRFAPDQAVTRAQMATFLVRSYEHVTGAALPVAADAFGDDDGDVHEASIDRAAQAGFAAGEGAGRYGPGQDIGRGQVSSFLVRVLDLLVEDGRTATP